MSKTCKAIHKCKKVLEGFYSLGDFDHLYMLKPLVVCFNSVVLQIMINLLLHYQNFNFKFS